jgi:hypothetical protein
VDDTITGGRYRLIRRLGRGGMGEVWLAHDALLDRSVAVKRLLTGTGNTDLPAQDDLRRLMREARLAARLNHPNAVAVYDVVLEGGQPDVIMEYVPGQTLADRIGRAGRLPVGEGARVGAAVADALSDAHGLGIVHRDVKPANILITERGVPKLADFGIARLGGDPAGNTDTAGFLLGTPAFLSPEVARGGPVDSRSDIWSLGITLYAALEGRSPFQAGRGDNTLAVLSRVTAGFAPPPPHGGPLTHILMRMISPDPGARPSAHEVAAVLPSAPAWSAAPAVPPVPGSPASPSYVPPARRSRVPLAVAVLVAVLVVAGGVVLLVALSGGGTPAANRSTAATRPPTPTTTSASTGLGVAEEKYYAPGGITVTAPTYLDARHVGRHPQHPRLPATGRDQPHGHGLLPDRHRQRQAGQGHPHRGRVDGPLPRLVEERVLRLRAPRRHLRRLAGHPRGRHRVPRPRHDRAGPARHRPALDRPRPHARDRAQRPRREVRLLLPDRVPAARRHVPRHRMSAQFVSNATG